MKHPIIKWMLLDIVRLACQKRTWFFLSISALVCGDIFLFYWEEFLSIQNTLRSKGGKYGVDAIVLFPYLKTMGIVMSVVIVFLGARIGYWDIQSHYSKVFLCHIMQHNKGPFYWLLSKLLVVSLFSVFLILPVAAPIVLSGMYYTYDENWFVLTLLGLWGLNIILGLLALVLSLKIKSSVVVVFFTCFIFFGMELIRRLLVEPLWLSDILSFYSPIYHMINLSIGTLSFSSIVFFFSWLLLMLLICYRMFMNHLSKL